MDTPLAFAQVCLTVEYICVCSKINIFYYNRHGFYCNPNESDNVSERNNISTRSNNNNIYSVRRYCQSNSCTAIKMELKTITINKLL